MSAFKGFSKSVLLIDFESTGFVKNAKGDVDDPGEPTQLGAVLLNANTLAEEKSFLSDINADSTKLDAWVLENTDITAERLEKAPSRNEVASLFQDKFGDNIYLASWNVGFDRFWLDTLMRSIARRDSMYDYHHIDVWSLAYTYLCQHGRPEVVRSEDTFRAFGQSARAAHNALDDCRRTAEVLRAVVFDKGIQV